MATDIPTVEQWKATLPDCIPTPNMMRWMSKYHKPCTKGCCFADACACIRCSGCRQSLTRGDIPQVRLQCMECPFVLDGTAASSRPELCQSCFDAGETRALHNHQWFCRIDEHGIHSLARRHHVVPIQPLTLQHFRPVHDLSLVANKECMVCCEPFSTSSSRLPVSPAGCERGHGESKMHLTQGIVDSRLMYCGECALAFEQSRDRGFFCDLSTYCECCQFEREMDEWRKEFRDLVSNKCIDNKMRRNVLEELLVLHVQPWIQAIAKEEFSRAGGGEMS